MDRYLRVGMRGSSQLTLQGLWRCVITLSPSLQNLLDSEELAEVKCKFAMDEEQYRKLKQDLENDYKRKLEALDLLYSALGGKSAPADMQGLRPQSMTQLVRQALPNLGETFSIWEIGAEVERQYPALKGKYKVSSLSATLSRMSKRGEIVVVQKGEGPAPTIYKKGSGPP